MVRAFVGCWRRTDLQCCGNCRPGPRTLPAVWGQLQDHRRHRGAGGDREDPHPPGPARQGPAARAGAAARSVRSCLILKPIRSATRLTILRGLRSRVEVKSRQNEAIRADSGGEWHREREIVTKHHAIHRFFSKRRCPSGSGKRWFEIPIHSAPHARATAGGAVK